MHVVFIYLINTLKAYASVYFFKMFDATFFNMF